MCSQLSVTCYQDLFKPVCCYNCWQLTVSFRYGVLIQTFVINQVTCYCPRSLSNTCTSCWIWWRFCQSWVKPFQQDKLCITDVVAKLETTMTMLEELKLQRGTHYRKFVESYSEETAVLPQTLAAYGRNEIRSLVQYFGYLLSWEREGKPLVSFQSATDFFSIVW